MRDSDTWHKINYTNEAASWMKPLIKGNETGLACIPANWCVNSLSVLFDVRVTLWPILFRYLADLPPMMFVSSVLLFA